MRFAKAECIKTQSLKWINGLNCGFTTNTISCEVIFGENTTGGLSSFSGLDKRPMKLLFQRVLNWNTAHRPLILKPLTRGCVPRFFDAYLTKSLSGGHLTWKSKNSSSAAFIMLQICWGERKKNGKFGEIAGLRMITASYIRWQSAVGGDNHP